MKEAFWGIGIIFIGMLGIMITQLFQNITVRDDQIFYTMREVSEAAMFDSVDLTYYRQTGKVKIIEEKFVEIFTRRFVEASNISLELQIKDIIEEPPKVTVEVGTNIFSLTGDSFFMAQSLDAIIESKKDYSPKYLYGDINEDGNINNVDTNLINNYIFGLGELSSKQMILADVNGDSIVNFADIILINNFINGSIEFFPVESSSEPVIIGESISECDPLFDLNCRPNRACIEGDIKFLGWQDINDIPRTVTGVVSYNRNATHKVCENGFWVDKTQTVVSKPKQIGNVVEQVWDLELGSNIVIKSYQEKLQQHIISPEDTVKPTIYFLFNRASKIESMSDDDDIFLVKDTGSTGLLNVRYKWSTINDSKIIFDNNCNSTGLSEYTIAFNKNNITSTALFEKPTSDDTYFLHVCAIDVARNVSISSRMYIYGNVSSSDNDINPPIITFYNEQAFFSGLTNIATVQDEQSGLKTIRYYWSYDDGYSPDGVSKYRCDEGEIYNISSTRGENKINAIFMTGAPNIKYHSISSLYICAEDDSNNISFKSKSFIIDPTPPISLTMNPTNGYIFNGSIKVNINAIDNESGIKGFKYCKTSGTTCTPSIDTTGNQIELTEAGKWTVCFSAINRAGLSSEKLCSGNQAYKIYNQKATIEVTNAPTNWINEDRKAIIKCTANEGSCNTSSYQYRTSTTSFECNSNGTWKNYISGGVNISSNTYICMRGKNSLQSDYSYSSTVQFKVDKTPPSGTVTSSGATGKWRSDGPSVTFTPSDSESGVKSWEIAWYNTGTWGSYISKTGTSHTERFSTSGKRKARMRVYDKAGNSAVITLAGEYWVDLTNPTCTVSGGSSIWTNLSSGRTITGTCADSHSLCTGNRSFNYTADLNITNAGPGGTGVGGQVCDNVGRCTTCAANQTVRIDRTAPTFTSNIICNKLIYPPNCGLGYYYSITNIANPSIRGWGTDHTPVRAYISGIRRFSNSSGEISFFSSIDYSSVTLKTVLTKDGLGNSRESTSLSTRDCIKTWAASCAAEY